MTMWGALGNLYKRKRGQFTTCDMWQTLTMKDFAQTAQLPSDVWSNASKLHNMRCSSNRACMLAPTSAPQ